MVKKSQTIVATSQPVPVEVIKQEEIEKAKNPTKSVSDAPVSVGAPAEKKPKKKSVKKVETVVETVVVPTTGETTTPEVATPVTPATLATPITETPIVEEVDENAEVVEEEAEVPTADGGVVEAKKRNRRVVTKDSFYQNFEAFNEQFNTFMEGLKLEKGNKNSKTLLLKKIKQIQGDAYKLMKIKTHRDDSKPRSENNSGFMKPIKISEDLATFLNTNPEDLITRVHVTKKLCQYIKDQDLQNPTDRREIIPDEKLKNLFNMGTDKLTYYSMQRQIQQHIFKI
uniref:DM2 domain-containing protein n=1 Tax=viral metagenome TaxID=1070528 RepID=A0A6C0K5S4_9ZZZZ